MKVLSEIIDLCRRYNIHLNKKLSQNFLHAKHIILKEIQLARVSSKDIILDIGAGFGFLTEELAKRAKKVYAIEYDRNIYHVLVKRLDHYISEKRVIPILGDALKVPLPDDVNKIVSNPPFHIISPLLFRLARTYFQRDTFDLAVLIVQYDYALKLIAKPGEKRSRLSATIQYYANIELISKISRKNFFPPPEVDSALIRIIPNRRAHLVTFEEFNAVITRIFFTPNKTLRSSLSNILSKEELLLFMKELVSYGLSANKRIRNLTNDELELLVFILKKLNLLDKFAHKEI